MRIYTSVDVSRVPHIEYNAETDVNHVFPGIRNAAFHAYEHENQWHGTFIYFTGTWPANEYVEATDSLKNLLELAKVKWEEIKPKLYEALRKTDVSANKKIFPDGICELK